MKHLLTIERPVAGHDLDGVPDSWEHVAEEWGDVQPLSGREYEQAQQMQSTTTHKIRTHLVAGATSAMRLLLGQRVFAVESVRNEGERNRWLLWRCVEGGL